MSRRPAQAWAVTVVVLVLVACAGWAVRWFTPWDSRASFDSLQYARLAYQLDGQDKAEAYQSAVRVRCDAWSHVRSGPSWYPVTLAAQPALYESQCVRTGYRPGVNPRYEAIFNARPGYPALVALGLPLFGTASFGVVTFVGALALGLLVGVLALLCGLRLLGAVLAQVLVFLLPTGLWATRIAPEGLVAAGTVLGLIGAVLALRHGRVRLGAAVVAVTLLAMLPVKSADAVAVGSAWAGASALLLLLGGPVRRRAAAALLAGSLAGVAVSLAVSQLAGWPGLTATLQDLFTAHFTRPPVADPLHRLLRVDRKLPGHLLQYGPVVWAGVPALVVVAALGLRRLGSIGLMLAATGAAGVLIVLVHPVLTEIVRLANPLWLASALGVAALVVRPERRRSARLTSDHAEMVDQPAG